MHCPRCTGQLELSEVVRHGVTLDLCPSCGGLWLDKGELSKILGQMKQAESELDREFATIQPQIHHSNGHKYKRPKTAMEKLFDIFD
jgi:Zn-finger nucleic acid-binding protein